MLNENIPMYLFHQGTNAKAYEYLGSHRDEEDENFTYFRVWAPHAVAVFVACDRNNWTGEGFELSRINEQGLWEGHFEGFKEFDAYKYLIIAQDGRKLMKCDPYAFHAETRPGTASKIYELGSFEWTDGAWMKKRRRKNIYASPMNIYELHVGSTGNLGLSIGIMGAALGYRVTVHMSADARQWKKDLLRAKGVTVLEYGADYSYAVQKGRERAAEDPRSYFIDDENSVDLFLGYAVAARRLKAQLAEQNIAVDEEHPLLVYIPCGVGGAPGGICFGLKQEFGDAAHVYFAEPVEAPCMLLGLASGLQNAICVQDIGLTGRTAADGLAVSRPSGFAGETVKEMVGGGFTVSDEHLFTDLHALHETERLFVEPSACAGFAGAVELSKMTDYLESSGLGAHWENAAHIVWATGGALVPEGEREKYLAN